MTDIERDYIAYCNSKKCAECKYNDSQYSTDCVALYCYDRGVSDTYNTLMEIMESFDRPIAEQVAEAYKTGEW